MTMFYSIHICLQIFVISDKEKKTEKETSTCRVKCWCMRSGMFKMCKIEQMEISTDKEFLHHESL